MVEDEGLRGNKLPRDADRETTSRPPPLSRSRWKKPAAIVVSVIIIFAIVSLWAAFLIWMTIWMIDR